MSERHPGTAHLMSLLEPNPHLPPKLLTVSGLFNGLAHQLLVHCQDGPELTVALRKLLEAKDAAVRQALLDDNGPR